MSIGRKFTFVVVGALLLVIVAALGLFFRFEVREEKKKLDLFSRMTSRVIEETLAASMQERNSGRIDSLLKGIRNNEQSIGNIWLLNRQGVVKNSTDSASLGAKWNTFALSGTGSALRQGRLLDDGNTYRWEQPVVNKPACARCHGRTAEYNGMIVIDFSFAEIIGRIRKELYGSAAIMLTSLLVMGFAVLTAWKVVISRRLNSVTARVRLVKDGIYRTDPVKKGQDEFGRLEEDFNQMAAAVQARDAEKQNLVRELSRANEELVREIDSRKQGERMLREQKMFSDALLQNSAMATFVLDKEHRVLIWNKACEELTGAPAGMMVGTADHWKAFYRSRRPTLADIVLDGNTADLSALYDTFSRSTLAQNGLHAEGWYENLNGRDRYIIFDAAPIHDGAGATIAVIETLQDVTEQKKTQAALAGSEAKFRTIIETEPECVKLVSRDGVVLEINRAGLNMLEADGPDQVVGKPMAQHVVPEHRSAVLAHMERVFKDGTHTQEFEIVGFKGTRRWLETRAAMLPGAGAGGAMLAVTRDVTDRKRWERQLQEQLQFLQTLMDTIPMPVFYKDTRGFYQGCNKAFESYLGMPKEKLIGKSVYEVAPKELADEYFRRDEELFSKPGVQFYEFSVKHADGTRHEVIFNKATFTDASGSVAGLLGVMQDITERKQAEEKLRQTNQTLETLIHASPIPIQVIDPDGRIKLWNPAAERLFGWTADEALGRVNPIVPEDKMEEFKMLRDRVLRGDAFTGVETRRRKKDGSMVDLSLSTAPLRDRQGTVSGILALLVDITERKRVEGVVRRQYDTQTAINWILHISLGNMPIEKILQQALNLILSISWLSFESRGAIFLVEGRPERLVMKAERGLSDSIREECRIVPFGKCLCGRAAAKGEVQFSDTLEAAHEIRYGDITPHGHYCIPIKLGRMVMGVINIYLQEGHHLDDKEVEFLNAIANALAGVIKRSRAEAALQESEKRYRTLAEAAHDVIFILDRECRVGYLNSYGADLFHRKPHELKGKNLSDLFPPDIAARQLADVSTVFDTGRSVYGENPFSFEHRVTWLGTWLVPLKEEDGRVSSVLGVSRDITDRRRSEQERENLINDLQTALNIIFRSHKEWQDTFDSITDMIAIIDKEFKIVKANRAFSGYYGFHPKDMIGRLCCETCHGSSEPIAGCPHRKTIAERRAFSEEVLDKKHNRIFLTTTFPYISPDGEIIGSIHVSRDITDEKERERRLIASERLAALGQMASGIAHEINNPLASIAGCSEGLLSRIKKGQCDSELFETYLNIIQEEIFRCKSITTAMLSFVRKTTYEKKLVNVNETLDRTLEIIGFQGRLANVSIRKEYQAGPLPVQANEGELRQVFLVVITNALDAMEDKGTLTLQSGADGNSAFVRIADSGPGIPPENLSRIFDPFFTTKSEQGGTGLGLSIARKIMQNHNGAIDATSEPGKGSQFIITLPL